MWNCVGRWVAVMLLYLLTCWSLTAAQIGEQITDDGMREMVAEADRSGTGRVGPHVEGAVLVEPQLRPGAALCTPEAGGPAAQASVAAYGVAHFAPLDIHFQVGPDDFVHIVTSYAHHYDG